MKKKNVLRNCIFCILAIGIFIGLDYISFPSYIGFVMTRVHWDLWLNLINILLVIGLFIFTYKKIDERSIKREQNKLEISILLLQGAYNECKKYLDLLTDETVNKYVIPKIDFKKTGYEGSLQRNLQNAPFFSDSIIIDLAKDGHLEKELFEKYLNIKELYSRYINTRISFFDAPIYYIPIKSELQLLIEKELDKIDNCNKKI